MHKPLFAHRPPSVGVHLLSDPFPDFGSHPVSTGGDSSQPVPRKRAKPQDKTKKSGLRS